MSAVVPCAVIMTALLVDQDLSSPSHGPVCDPHSGSIAQSKGADEWVVRTTQTKQLEQKREGILSAESRSVHPAPHADNDDD